MQSREVITRRNLPHWFVPGAAHFVTYRLAGTIPVAVLRKWRARRDSILEQKLADGMSHAEHRELAHKQFFAEYDRYLDQTCKIDWLVRPGVAELLSENLYHHDGQKYHLLAYCVMPNHVHVLLFPIVKEENAAGGGGTTSRLLVATGSEEEPATSRLLVATSDEVPDGMSPLAGIMHSLKSYTANKANRLLNRSGQLWQHESYDHWVRDEAELERIVEYIWLNPVRAKLANEPHEWPYCSAHDQFVKYGRKTAGPLGDAP